MLHEDVNGSWVLFLAWGCCEDKEGRRGICPARARPIAVGWSSYGLCGRGPRGKVCSPQAKNTAFSLIGGNPGEGWGELFLFSVSASVEHLLQICIQKHPSGVQLFSDGTELWEGRIHFLKILPGAAVGLWKQQVQEALVPGADISAGLQTGTPCPCACMCDIPTCRHTHTRMHPSTHTHACA